MINARDELIKHVGDREVELVRIVLGRSYGEKPQRVIEGGLDTVLQNLDFQYENGFGSQELFGYIWYKDGTWSERGEYDGSEWWKHMERPALDTKILT